MPKETAFATKVGLVEGLAARAVAAGVPSGSRSRIRYGPDGNAACRFDAEITVT